jgi:hypothetical protein
MLLVMLVGGTVTGMKMARLKRFVSRTEEAVAIEAILAQTQDKASSYPTDFASAWSLESYFS